MKEKIARRRFLKYVFSLGGFGITSLLEFNEKEGFLIGKMKDFDIDVPQASAVCGMGFGCAGGGGQCGMGFGCAGN